MTVRVGPNGEVVIPKSVRDRVGLHPGDEVDFELRGHGEVVLVAMTRRTAPAGRFRGSGMAARLLADRGQEPR